MGSVNPQFRVDIATSDDIPQICTIERSATTRYGQIPALAHLVDGTALAESTVQSWLDEGCIFLAKDILKQNEAVGFAACHPKDSRPYLAEISVSSDYHRQGVGGLLLQVVKDYGRREAASKGESARITLTTYPDVLWTGPWYSKFGFVEVEAEELGPEHVAKMVTDEETRDLVQPGYRRCCMIWEEIS
ncbi:hypothetical protein K431DRAFT_285021 [Polychaeton citri CBS 116435]|uniref:N-acetyltransferase domain-containing protein n=1 Tax=Polychaeton citri CBS 116435 TaxID=1314669 RepID=A0A9P4UNY0_9PEZI|nr:hypothetical protein K431DRAFT_285021 [Polychaeton citri CBS 116435]